MPTITDKPWVVPQLLLQMIQRECCITQILLRHVNKNKQSTVVSQYSKGQVNQEYSHKKYHF
jgi:hypothetical protein